MKYFFFNIFLFFRIIYKIIETFEKMFYMCLNIIIIMKNSHVFHTIFTKNVHFLVWKKYFFLEKNTLIFNLEKSNIFVFKNISTLFFTLITF